MRGAAIRAGWSVLRLGGRRAPEELAGQASAIYGEVTFAEAIASQLGLTLMDVPPDWLPDLPEHHRRRNIRLSTLGEARTAEYAAFVKPADGRKGFEGRVYARGGLGLPPAEAHPDDTPVLIADPVSWVAEYRCFVADGAVVTVSPYLRAGELAIAADGSWPMTPDESAAVHAYAESVLAEVPVPPAVVLDVGLIADRGWAVVEANSAWGAGVYGCDPDQVFTVLARSCVPADRLHPADARWAARTVRVE